MEIKIQCGCGVRFAFEVEPIQGKMPIPLACPRCGADQTAQANHQIALKLAPPPLPNGKRGLKILNLPGYNVDLPPPIPAVTPLPVTALHGDTTALAVPIGDNRAAKEAPVVAAAEATASPSPAPAAGGLRVGRTKKEEHHTPPPAPVASAPVEESAAPRRTYTPPTIQSADDESPRGIWGWIKVSGKAIASTAVVFLVALKFLVKMPFAVKIIAAIFGAAAASNSVDDLADKWNFKYEDATQIYVKADDQQKVITACNTYWKNQNKSLKVEGSGLHSVMENHYLVTPMHQGYVAIVGSLNWNPEFVTGLAKELSTQLNTTAIVFSEKNDLKKGGHHFSIYEGGQKQFAHTYEVAMVGKEIKDNFKVEGEEWVKQKGYFKPDKDGFAYFDTFHANMISHKLGLHWYDFPDPSNGYQDLSD